MQKRKSFGTAIPRLQQDYMNLNKGPVPYIRAEPLPSDMLEWHYVIQGPEDTPYLGGYYHGTLIFTQQYPFKPPSIYMSTPNGRFEVNRRLCLSISDFHPDQWNPAWCVETILTGLLSFMLESSPAVGTIQTHTHEKIRYARQSLAFNLKQETFRTLFPDLTTEIQEKLVRIRELEKANAGPDADPSLVSEADPPRENFIDSDYASSSLNNILLVIFTGLMGLIAYHIFGIMNAE